MPQTININGSTSGMTLVHKGSEGVATATLPDVCKTPSPGGPIPLPYLNIARSSDLAKGTKTIKVDGGNPAAHKTSEFSRSTGDEPGTAGGVKSSTQMKEATWLSYSYDVKFEGQGACRLSDKMLMNHGNTACLQGVIQPPQFTPPTDDVCARLYAEIFELLFGVRTRNPQGFPLGTKGLAFRWEEAAKNLGNWTPSQNQTHLGEYKKLQEKLNKKLEEWRNKKRRDCDDNDLPPGADLYAEQVPALGPGKPIMPTAPSASALDMDALGKALGVSGGVAIGIVVISRIIRCFPPLLPLQLSPI